MAADIIISIMYDEKAFENIWNTFVMSILGVSQGTISKKIGKIRKEDK